MYENRGGTEIYYSYDSYGAPTSIKYYEPDGTTYTFYLATNQQGDVIGIYNSSGNLAVKYEYDAWGNIISETNASGGTLSGTAAIWNEINPFRYRGYYYDAETGLYYLQSRYYDAETGRFINQDSYISTGTGLLGFNMFAYCGNNPILYIDLSGARYCEATSVNKENSYNRYVSSNWQRKICLEKYNPEPIDILDNGGKVYFVEDKNDVLVTFSNDVVIEDKRNTSKREVIIYNSALINDKAIQQEIVTVLFEYEKSNQTGWTRTVDSMMIEWEVHNIGYKITNLIPVESWYRSCCDVNFDSESEGLSSWEMIIKRITK